jgi:hypothetical protein
MPYETILPADDVHVHLHLPPGYFDAPKKPAGRTRDQELGYPRLPGEYSEAPKERVGSEARTRMLRTGEDPEEPFRPEPVLTAEEIAERTPWRQAERTPLTAEDRRRDDRHRRLRDLRKRFDDVVHRLHPEDRVRLQRDLDTLESEGCDCSDGDLDRWTRDYEETTAERSPTGEAERRGRNYQAALDEFWARDQGTGRLMRHIVDLVPMEGAEGKHGGQAEGRNYELHRSPSGYELWREEPETEELQPIDDRGRRRVGDRAAETARLSHLQKQFDAHWSGRVL